MQRVYIGKAVTSACKTDTAGFRRASWFKAPERRPKPSCLTLRGENVLAGAAVDADRGSSLSDFLSRGSPAVLGLNT